MLGDAGAERGAILFVGVLDRTGDGRGNLAGKSIRGLGIRKRSHFRTHGDRVESGDLSVQRAGEERFVESGF